MGDISLEHGFKEGSLSKIGLHAIMGGLAAEAAGGDFKSGALVAGANEALIDTLAKQYGSMSYEQRSDLLTMNSQVLGVLVASMAGGDEEDMQIGASIAGNATKYNWDLHLPPGMMQYGQSTTSLAQYMQEQGFTSEEISSALRAMARGDGFSGPEPAKEFLKAWAMVTLTGVGMVSVSGGVVTVIVGSAVGGGSNVAYQVSTKDLKDLSYTDATIATVVGGLTQGKGVVGTAGISMGGAYVGSQIKGEDATAPVIGAGVGASIGYSSEKIISSKLGAYLPEKVSNILGSVFGNLFSEKTTSVVEGSEKGK